jgi:two-component system catabolic regulation response regulator CreB
MRLRILVVEDEPAIAESIAYALERDGFEAITAGSLGEAKAQLSLASLVVLDLMLPDGSGFDFIGDVRRDANATPIIVLSSRDGEADRVAALETGADDYVTKPFSPREVVARVRAVLRRNPSMSPPAPASWKPPLRVDAMTRRAHLDDRLLELTRVEFDLLATLLGTPGRVFTRSELIDRVWGDGYAITDRTIDSHVKSLRRKVSEAGGDPALIETVRGVGYRVIDEKPEG